MMFPTAKGTKQQSYSTKEKREVQTAVKKTEDKQSCKSAHSFHCTELENKAVIIKERGKRNSLKYNAYSGNETKGQNVSICLVNDPTGKL